jgi:hypothetical protein
MRLLVVNGVADADFGRAARPRPVPSALLLVVRVVILAQNPFDEHRI